MLYYASLRRCTVFRSFALVLLATLCPNATAGEGSIATANLTELAHIFDVKSRFETASTKNTKCDSIPLHAISRIGSLRLRQPQIADSLDLSPDGTALASINGRELRLWKTKSGELCRRILVDSDPSGSLLFADGGKTVVCALEGCIAFWDAESGKEIRRILTHERAISIALSADGRRLAACVPNKSINVWDISTGTEVGQIPWIFKRDIIAWQALTTRVAISWVDTGTLSIFHLAWDGTPSLFLWNVDTGKRRSLALCVSNGEKCTCSAHSPDGKLLALGDERGLIRIVSLARCEEEIQHLVGNRIPVTNLRFAPRGGILACTFEDGAMKLWDTKTGKTNDTPHATTAWCKMVAFSGNGKLMAAPGMGHEIRLWDVNLTESKEVFPSQSPVKSAFPIAFTSNSEKILVHGDGYLELWRTRTGERCTKELNLAADSAAISLCEKLLAIHRRKRLEIWNVSEAKRLVSLGGLRKDDSRISNSHQVAFSHDEKFVVSGRANGVIDLHEAGTWKTMRSWLAEPGGINAIVVSPSCEFLASVGQKMVNGCSVVNVWEVNTAEHLHSLVHAGWASDLAISPNGKMVAATGQGGTNVWEASTGKLRYVFPPGTRVAFSPHGRNIAVGGKVLSFYDMTTGELVRKYDSQSGNVTGIVFSLDGKRVAAGYSDATVLIWEAVAGSSVRQTRGSLDLNKAWEELASDNGETAAKAMHMFLLEPVCRRPILPCSITPGSEKMRSPDQDSNS